MNGIVEFDFHNRKLGPMVWLAKLRILFGYHLVDLLATCVDAKHISSSK